MDGAVLGIGGFLGLCVIFWIYYTIKAKAKRGLFFKEQYERQKAVTHYCTVITTAAAPEQVKAALNRTIPTDDSFRGNFVGGNFVIRENSANRVEYYHRSSFTTGGEGDEFTGSVTFRLQDGYSKVTVQIERWREKDGVTRRAGIEAMEGFLSAAQAAVLEIDPSATVERVAK